MRVKPPHSSSLPLGERVIVIYAVIRSCQRVLLSQPVVKRLSIFQRTRSFGRHYFVKRTRKVAIWGKTSSMMQQTHRAIR
jgi:hypothetical protein